MSTGILDKPNAAAPPALQVEPLVSPENWRSLPATLRKPPMAEIDPRKIESVKKEWKDIPVEHIKDGWTWIMYRLQTDLVQVFVDPPKSTLREHTFKVNDNALSQCFTHCFAVYSYPHPDAAGDPARRQIGQEFRRAVTLYPTHAVIWAAYAANLPAMRPSTPEVAFHQFIDEGRDAERFIKLPVVSVPLPYPEIFHLVHQFLYCRLRSVFIRDVFRYEEKKTKFNGLSEGLTEQDAELVINVLMNEPGSSLLRLSCYATNVYSLWRNVIALGISDERLWSAIDFAWSVLLRAFEKVEERDGPWRGTEAVVGGAERMPRASA